MTMIFLKKIFKISWKFLKTKKIEKNFLVFQVIAFE